jgi:hypothetical protein
MRQYLKDYFIDKLAKTNDINEVLELLFFASDTTKSPLLLKSYFEETVHSLLEIPQLNKFHDAIAVIKEASYEIKINVEDIAEELGIEC